MNNSQPQPFVSQPQKLKPDQVVNFYDVLDKNQDDKKKTDKKEEDYWADTEK